jgi:hypothetical protein
MTTRTETTAKPTEWTGAMLPGQNYAVGLNLTDEEFIAEAIARAETAGYRPAATQRDIDWTEVRAWVSRIRSRDFLWLSRGDRNVDPIIVGPDRDGGLVVHSGQHRILAGLMACRPVPPRSITWLSIEDRRRDWDIPSADLSLNDLLRVLAL